MYRIDYSKKALQDLEYHNKAGNKSISIKIYQLINEISVHPFKGTGKPEQLKYDLSGFWSRRINREHRIIYQVDDFTKIVTIHSLIGHYN